MTSPPGPAHRRMPWWALVLALLAFLLLPALGDLFVFHPPEADSFPDPRSAADLLGQQLVALAVALVVVAAYRWWRPVLREDLRAARWVWLAPGAVVVVAVALIDWGRLGQFGIAPSLLLFVASLVLATAEETMFRGVLLVFLRDRYREWVAAVSMVLVFGLAHLVNGVPNAVFSALFGYVLYWSRRVSGVLLVPIVVHALYDFSIFSTQSTSSPNAQAPNGFSLAMLSLLLVVVLGVAHRRAQPAEEVAAG